MCATLMLTSSVAACVRVQSVAYSLFFHFKRKCTCPNVENTKRKKKKRNKKREKKNKFFFQNNLIAQQITLSGKLALRKTTRQKARNQPPLISLERPPTHGEMSCISSSREKKKTVRKKRKVRERFKYKIQNGKIQAQETRTNNFFFFKASTKKKKKNTQTYTPLLCSVSQNGTATLTRALRSTISLGKRVSNLEKKKEKTGFYFVKPISIEKTNRRGKKKARHTPACACL